jgi:hypothetical protein
MKRRTILVLVLLAALAAPASSIAAAPPVGPLPAGPVTTIAAKKGTLVSVAVKSRSGLSWRVARRVDPKVLVQVGEANVGSSVVLVYRAVGRGQAKVVLGLTRGEEAKAHASATFAVRIS